MSSETYDLLKRPDEFFVVNKAHHNPKFVEDVVRGILARALDVYADLRDETFVFATQVNDESIHKHDAFAEGFGLFGELREELRTGTYVTRRPTSRPGWAPARRRCSSNHGLSSAAIRARNEGCEAKKSSYHAGGSSSARFCSRRRRNAAAPAAGSRVAARANRSAVHSREREKAKSSGRSACVATSMAA